MNTNNWRTMADSAAAHKGNVFPANLHAAPYSALARQSVGFGWAPHTRGSNDRDGPQGLRRARQIACKPMAGRKDGHFFRRSFGTVKE